MANNPYLDYFSHQAGGGGGYQRGGGPPSVFRGQMYQRGGQIGNGFFSNLFRYFSPFLRQTGLQAAQHLLSSGSSFLNDIKEGQNVKSSLKQRLASTGKLIAKDALSNLSSQMGKGRGYKRKRSVKIDSFASKRRRVSKRKQSGGKRRTKRKTGARRTKRLTNRDRFG